MTEWWKVVPLCERQLLDVDPNDVIAGGHFRLCNTYKSGGGYDQFPAICERRIAGLKHSGLDYRWQFVVQLYGCHLACPYCYVTPDGIFGSPVNYSSYQLVSLFNYLGARVFHLMGGAPALYLNQWPELLEELDIRGKQFQGKPTWVFHSDLLLTEGFYDRAALEKIKHPRALYAVGIKGIAPLDYHANTGRAFPASMFWENLLALEEVGVPYYFTFTNCPADEVERFWDWFKVNFPNSYELQRRDAFSIDLVKYKALQ